MKLNKKKLIKAVRTHLEELGYLFFKTSTVDIVFAKRIRKGLYLSLTLTIHRFYDDQFTGDYTIAPTTHYLENGGFYPWGMSKRVGKLLTKSERQQYADEAYPDHDYIDCWWEGLNNESVQRFIGAIQVTEQRFVDNSNIEEILNNTHIQREVADQEKVTAYLGKTEQYKDYQYLPTRCLCAPIEWYQAAELLAIEENIKSKDCKYAVQEYAENAYRVYVLETGGCPIQ